MSKKYKINKEIDPCIICLGDEPENIIIFPTKYSECNCKYNIHLECLHKLPNKNCVMNCGSSIQISKKISDVENTFQHTTPTEVAIRHIGVEYVTTPETTPETTITTPHRCICYICLKNPLIYILIVLGIITTCAIITSSITMWL